MPADRPWLKHYDEGVPHTLEYPTIPAHAIVESNAKDYPDNPALIFKGNVISHRECNELADRMAAGLVAMGVKKGDRVSIYLPMIPELPFEYHVF